MRPALLSCLCLCALLASACASAPADAPEETKAIFDRGLAAYDAKDYTKAFQLFSSIDDRDLAAMRNVALMLRRGEGTQKDPKAAEEMYARAAQGGLATAAADLGEMLLNGEAGAPDAKAAFPWLNGAAAAGHPIAQFELATMYESGNGVPKDVETARKLYRLAADGGMDEAAKRLAALPAGPAK
ncbi:MAG: sel1 repeat family protein [Alphaproteobacteria bacterium]|nr:sel1 repeat family protein [Alphaproteobacteria bacterium]MBV9692406.1 sel1 repeat family protein [Alphaproteobacteria bacterium]